MTRYGVDFGFLDLETIVGFGMEYVNFALGDYISQHQREDCG